VPFGAECSALGKARFAECLTLPSAALDKAFFAECPTKGTRQRSQHSAKPRIPVVVGVDRGDVATARTASGTPESRAVAAGVGRERQREEARLIGLVAEEAARLERDFAGLERDLGSVSRRAQPRVAYVDGQKPAERGERSKPDQVLISLMTNVR
jgi:hypothetical protein